MNETDIDKRGYIIAALVGAIGGGLVVTLASRAIPKIMSEMMQNIMSNMEACGADPADM